MLKSVETELISSCKNRGRYRSYSFDDRLKAVSMSEQGMSSLAISRVMGIDSSLIRGWIRRYKKEGLDGLKHKPYRNVPAESPFTPVSTLDDSSQETVTSNGNIKGFVHFVDNPALVRSMVNTLSAYGVHPDNIVVREDICEYLESLEPGDTLVINSLFDLSSNFSKMLFVLGDLLKADVTLVSISDNGQKIKPGDMDSLEIVSILKNYLSVAWMDVSQRTNPPAQSPSLTRSQKIEDSFTEALEIYMKGHTMAFAARTAGCSYSSFRYWLTNKKSEHQASLINE